MSVTIKYANGFILGIVDDGSLILTPTPAILDLRPSNKQFNIIPVASDLTTYLSKVNIPEAHTHQEYFKKVDGNFAGLTQDIIAYFWKKWFPEFDVDYGYAIAVTESHWNQNAVGDNGVSFGIVQIKKSDWPVTYPCSKLYTGFNCDFKFAYQRMVYDGFCDYLADLTEPKPINASPYRPTTQGIERLLGSIGNWYSGHWYDQGAVNYIKQVNQYYTDKPWTKSGF